MKIHATSAVIIAQFSWLAVGGLFVSESNNDLGKLFFNG